VLSDGWYSIEAAIDAPMVELVKRGRIWPGMKLRIACAQLQEGSVEKIASFMAEHAKAMQSQSPKPGGGRTPGAKHSGGGGGGGGSSEVDGCDPLETVSNAAYLKVGGWNLPSSEHSNKAQEEKSSKSSIADSAMKEAINKKPKKGKGRGMGKPDLLASRHLILHTNSTRRARWDARLGFQAENSFKVALHSLVPEGGPAPLIEVTVVKQYAQRYLATFPDGSKKVVSNRARLELHRRHCKMNLSRKSKIWRKIFGLNSRKDTGWERMLLKRIS